MFSELTRTSRSMSDQHELEERVKTAQAECERLREENVRLRAMLSIHDPVLEHAAADVQVAMLARMYKKRLSGYAALGYTVVDGLDD